MVASSARQYFRYYNTTLTWKFFYTDKRKYQLNSQYTDFHTFSAKWKVNASISLLAQRNFCQALPFRQSAMQSLTFQW